MLKRGANILCAYGAEFAGQRRARRCSVKRGYGGESHSRPACLHPNQAGRQAFVQNLFASPCCFLWFAFPLVIFGNLP
jgi:hypothetical protein